MSDSPYTLGIGLGMCALIGLATDQVTRHLDNQTAALTRIAAAQEEIARNSKPQPLNAECHETLNLFDEWLKHDLKTGGSGRKQQ